MEKSEIDAKILELSQRDNWDVDAEVHDEDLQKALIKYNLVYTDRKNDVVVRSPARNRINPEKMPIGTPEQIEAFKNLELEEPIEIEGEKLVLSKMAGDEYAQILTPEGDSIVAFIKFITDTRYPWLNLEGDTRPQVLKTTERSPSRALVVSGWSLEKQAYNGKVHKCLMWRGKLSLWNFDGSVVRMIRQKLPAGVRTFPKKERKSNTDLLNNIAAKRFMTSTFGTEIQVGDKKITITKDKSCPYASLFVGEEEIGQARINNLGGIKKASVFFVADSIDKDTRRDICKEVIPLMQNPPQDLRPVEVQSGTVKSLADISAEPVNA